MTRAIINEAKGKDGWTTPALLLSQYDFTEDAVMHQVTTTTLRGRSFKTYLQSMDCSAKGVMKVDSRTIYVKDLTLDDEATETIAELLSEYQDKATTKDLGIEIDLFLKLYIHFGERTLLHEDEGRWDTYDKAYEQQEKFWNSMSGPERSLARLIHYERRQNAARIMNNYIYA